MSAALLPNLRFQPLSAAGRTLPGALLHVYLIGTSTPAVAYEDRDLSAEHENPVEADIGGVFPSIYLTDGGYTLALTTALGVPVDSWEYVVGPDALGVTIPLGGSVSVGSTDTTYPTGATLDKILLGTSTVPLDSIDLVGTWKLRGMLKHAGGVAVTVALVNLSDGAPNTAIVEITSTSTVGELVTSAAITFATAGAAKTYALKMKVASGIGQGWDFALIRTE